ncbi:hypothetical protein RD792_015285 [Penstemon davidsonii]|uniref:Galactose oxidase-like Early set domain-containing protein n=1 Tax=Penstemon davidsonii TaxID=160366 RepID=A0ABR0CRS3_9LAMI|nr:hypothetical protein RD792_015285 [Penstemon davidsonii]
MKAAKGIFVPASKTCGRLRVTDPDPKRGREEMPSGRVMPDMLRLPTGAVIILNGAEKGTAGWEYAVDPSLNPVLYFPDEPDPNKRFTVLNPTPVARMYPAAATLLPDGRISVAGSNTHRCHLRPSILSVEGPTDNFISYGQAFSITFSLGLYQPVGEYIVTMVAPSFTTHSFAMNQRLMVLYIVSAEQLSTFAYKVTVYAPATANVAPPGYYMVFVVHQGVPSYCAWIRMK